MSTITVHCSHCGASLKLKDRSKLGKKVACPKCRQPFVLTASDAPDDEWDDLGSVQSSGHALPPRSATSPPKPQKKKASSDGSGQTGLLIGVGVLALLAIVGGGIWLVGSMLGGDGGAPADGEAVAASGDESAPGESPPPAQMAATDPAAGHGTPASPPESPPAPNIPESEMDLAWLPSDTELLFRLRPADLIATPLIQGILEGSGETDPFAPFQQQTGVSPQDIQAVAYGGPGITDTILSTLANGDGLNDLMPAEVMDDRWVAVIRFHNPIDASRLRLPGSGEDDPATSMGGAADTTNMRASQPADLSDAMPAEPTPGPSEGHGASGRSSGPAAGHGSSGSSSDGPSGGHGASSSGSSSSGSSSGGPAREHGSSGNSSGGSSSSGNTGSGPRYFTFQPPSKATPPLTLCLVDARTLLVGQNVAAIRRLVERGPDATLPTTFNYLAEGRQVSLAFDMKRMPALVQKLEDFGTELPAGVAELVSLLNSGATGISLGLSLDNGLDLDVSMAGDNPEAGQRLQEIATSLVQQISESFETGRDQMPPMVAPFVTPLVENLRAIRSENVVRITTSLPDETLNNGVQMAQSMLPMLMMSMMAGGMGGGADFEGMSSGEEVLTEGVPAAEVEGAPDGIELKGLATWSTTQNFNGGVTPPAPLLVRLGLTGGPAGQVVSYGQVRVLEASTDAGERLKQTRPDLMITDQYFGYVDIDRNSFGKQPADATIISLAFYPPLDNARTLQTLAGEVTLKLADESRDILIPDVSRLINREPSDPDLAAAGLTVSRQQFNGGNQVLSIRYDQSGDVMVSAVTAVDASGLPLQTVASGHTLFNGIREFTISPLQGSPLPETLGLRITIQKGLTDVPVTFRFSDLELPEPPAPLTDGQRAMVTWQPSTESDVPIDDVRVEAQIQWSPHTAFVNGQQVAPPMIIAVDVVGPGAENVVAVGDLKVRTALLAPGHPLKKRQERIVPGGGFEAVDRTFLSDDFPVDGVRAKFEFEPPESLPESIQAFSGSLTLRTVREQKTVQIGPLSSLVGRRLTHVELNKAGVQLALIERGNQHQLNLIRGSAARIASMELTDATGQVLPDAMVSQGNVNGRVFYSLTTGSRTLDELGLQITVNVGMRDIEVPFRFLNLPVPPKPEPQPPGNNQFELTPDQFPEMSAPGMSLPGALQSGEPPFEPAGEDAP